jgi:hypothetical protein
MLNISLELCGFFDVLICLGYVFVGCPQELKSTMFCIIDAGCCPLLKRLEGNKKHFYIFYVNFSVLNFQFVYNPTKELR